LLFLEKTDIITADRLILMLFSAIKHLWDALPRREGRNDKLIIRTSPDTFGLYTFSANK
jgi:hypothetical protein